MTRLAAVYTNTPTANSATYELSSPFDFRQDHLRLDYRVNPAHGLSARYLHDHSRIQNVTQPPSLVTNRPRPTYSGADAYVDDSPEVDQRSALHLSKVFLNNIPLGDSWRRDTYGFVFKQRSKTDATTRASPT